MIRECKGRGGRPSPEQKQRIAELREAGLDVDVWTPEDLEPDGGRVRREMEAIGRRSRAG